MFHSMNILRLFQIKVATCRNWIEQVETHYKCVTGSEIYIWRPGAPLLLRRAALAALASARPPLLRHPPPHLCDSLPCSPAHRDNPFHNFRHAFSVLHKTWMFLFRSSLRANLQDIDVFALLFAAVSHDLEHPGTTNNFQCNSMTDLALMYNDASVLEVRPPWQWRG